MKNEAKKTVESLYEIITPEDLVEEQLGGWIQLSKGDGQIEPETFPIGKYTFDARIWTEGSSQHWLTPTMREEDRESLEASIREQGILEQITVSHTGEIIDGFHRLSAWLRLVLDGSILPHPPYRLVRFRDDEAESSFVMAQNMARRHLDHEDKIYLLQQLLKSGHTGTDGWLADIVRIHAETVRDVRAALESLPTDDGGIDFKELRVSKAGKTYKQKPIKPKSQKRCKEAKAQARSAIVDQVEKEEPTVVEPVSNETTVGVTTEPEYIVDEVAEVNEYESLESEVTVPESEADEKLRKLISLWWREFNFMPVLSRELYRLELMLEGHEGEYDRTKTKGAADRITRMLKPLVGSEVQGHLILSRKMSAAVSVFVLAPSKKLHSDGINEKVLLARIGDPE